MNLAFTHSLAGPGDVIIEGLSPVRAFAERDSSFIPLPFDELEALQYQNTEGGRLIKSQLANTRWQEIDLAHVTRFGFRTLVNKAAYALMMYGPFAKRIQTPEGEVWDISSIATQSELAQAAGMDRKSFTNVVLGQLERRNVIKRLTISPEKRTRATRGRGIQVVDV